MTTYLTDEGYTAPRAAQILTEIRDDFEARLADRELSTDVDWDRDVLLGILTAVVSDRLGSVSELTQVLHDSADRNNASGLFLDNLGIIVGIPRQEATFSTVTIACGGDDGTVITEGSLVRDDEDVEWEAQEDGTISGGSVGVTFQAETKGAITASAGTITEILTPIDGWDSATNAAAASPGQARELDADYRLRQQQSLQASGGSTTGALQSDLLDLDYVDAAVVVDNPSGNATTEGGVSLDPYAVAVILHPDTLTSDQKIEAAKTIFTTLAMSTPMMGSDEAYNVTKADGATKTIYWDWATPTAVATVVTVTLETGYVIGDVDTEIEEAVETLFGALDVGEAIYDLDVLDEVADVEGVKRATVTLAGTTGVEPDLGELLTEGSTTVTT